MWVRDFLLYGIAGPLSSPYPIVSVYISSHGYGHATRTTALLERLAARVDVKFRVRASCPRWLWPPILEQRTLSWLELPCDAGVVQSGDLKVDRAATKAALAQWRAGYDKEVERECARHRDDDDASLIFSDVAPLAFDVADRLGLRAVAMANFTWDWIYRELGYCEEADRAASAYAHAELLLELEPGCPMPAFGARKNIGVIGRRSANNRHAIRKRLGIAPEERLIMPGFRSLDPRIVSLPDPELALRYVIPGNPIERADIVDAPATFTFVDLLAAADLVVAKPGYGIIGDCAVAGTPMLYPSRVGFPEDPYLERWLADQTVSAPIDAQRLAEGNWIDDAEALLARERPHPRSDGGLDEGCDELLRLLA